MSTTLTPTAARTTVTVPTGTDRVNIADLTTTMGQALANRAEWAAKSLISVQTARLTATNQDYDSASFVDQKSLAALSFSDVEIGDQIVLYAAASWKPSGTVAGITGVYVDQRFLVGGAVDATVANGVYPRLMWGSDTTAADHRMHAFLNVHTATAAAATLATVLQAAVVPSGGAYLTNTYAQIVGLHFRLGAA